nr:MAG TPA: hypothetical protein [Siphovirus LN-2020-2]
MTPVEPTKLTVYRGGNKEFESEGFYEVQVFSTDDGTMVFVNDYLINETVLDRILVEYVSVYQSSVRVKIKES